MDFSSDPLHDPMGSSPPDTTQIETEDTPNLTSLLPQSTFHFTSLQTPINRDSSSPDPVQEAPFSLDYSAPTDRPTRRNRKRGPGSSPDHPSKEPRIASQPASSAREAVLQARDLIIQACSLASSREEQSKLLDLLEVFREYTEKGRLKAASTIIASQIANLETATRQIETKAKALAKAPALEPRPTSTPTPSTASSTRPSPSSFASVAAKGTEPSPTAKEWTLVGKAKPATSKLAPKAIKPPKENRLILVKSATGTSASFSPLAARNTFNKAFADKGIKGPVVTSVTKSLSQNIVVTTTSPFTADFLLEKQAIWQHIVPFKSAQKDEPWHKVAIHGIPTTDFNSPEGMGLVLEEIKTFNKGLNPIGTPYWLTPASKRLTQRAGSVAVAFATEAEATRAIRNRLYIAGISARVEKLYSTAPTTQCTKCQGFGHLDSYCKKSPTCRLCSEKHATKQHYCTTCKAKGSPCPHLEPKCINCKGSHAADNKACEILLAIKNKATTTISL
jgi:hypothetical protein